MTPIELHPRGQLSEAVLDRLQHGADHGPHGEDLLRVTTQQVAASSDLLRDDDVQFALFLLQASHYGSLEGLDPHLEWDPLLITVRRHIEDAFEAQLRHEVRVPELPAPNSAAVAKVLFEMTAPEAGPSLARYVAKQASREQAEELLKQRSIYTLREADAHSWAIPRLRGRAKAALVEIQSDEYGGGRPERLHAEIFAETLRSAGLDDRYGAYADAVPAITLASFTMMTMFGLNRRLVGASVGHLAAFEMTSSIPSRFIADGLRRLGYGERTTAYFDEHVEADAVHEQIAAHDLAGSLAEDRPDLLPDIIFGAAACLTVDGWAGSHLLETWERGASSLRERVLA
ncbi:MAG: iron-containing redox enzyme family protein [Leucobacter sp.]